ncbi:MAG: glycosyltransferase family 4 protein [Acidobacteria bacterium]|nr:glycosyltransferase family 4 protein [Acidobacteriota bacterium]MCA1651263.1 glycosyltransferase family 4 protein [Acidobacteriota bacterium]
MNILIVTPFFTPQTGGVTTHIETLRGSLTERGHSMLVLRPGDSNAIECCSETRDCRVWRLYMRPLWCPEAPLRGLIACLAYLAPTVYRLSRFVQLHGIEIVSLEYPVAGMAYFLPVRWWTRVKLVAAVHGDDVHSLHLRPWHERWLVRQIVSRADRLLAHSSRMLADAERDIGKLPTARSHLPCSLDCEALRRQADLIKVDAAAATTPLLPYALTVAKLYRRKGLDVLLEALAALRHLRSHIQFVIAGDGPEEAALRRRAAELKLEELVVFAGEVQSGDIPALIEGCEFFVLPSRSEPFGIALLEAMTFGKAVLATSVGGIPEFVRHEVNGLLVPSEDPRALAEGIQRLVTDLALRDRLGRTGQQVVEREYDRRALAPKYEAMYASVLASTHPKLEITPTA